MWPRALVFLVLILGACARPACPVHLIAPDGHPLLWEASQGGRTIYLYGTYHVAGEADIPYLAWDKLAASSAFMTELDDADPAKLTELTKLPHAESLEAMLPADAWLDLRDALEGVVHDPRDLARLRPWYAMSLLTSALYHAPSPSMDSALRARATAQHARLVFLESWDEQLAILGKSVGTEDLLQAIHDKDHVRCELEGAMAAYRAGDLPALARDLDLAQADELVSQRNLRWIDRIGKALPAQGALFVSVGVSHLIGPDSLPALLARQGYDVHRL